MAAYTLSAYRLSSVPFTTARPSPFSVQASRSYDALSLSSTDTTPGLHVAELDAVAGLVGRVDDERQVASRLVEGELGHVADVEVAPGGQVAQDEVRALRPVAGRARAAGRLRRRAPEPEPRPHAGRAAGRRRLLQRNPAAALAGEREAADVLNRHVLARRQVEQLHLGLDGPALPPEPLALGARLGYTMNATHFESSEKPQRRRWRARLTRPARAAAGHGRRLAHRELVDLVAVGRLDEHVAVAFHGRHAVGEPAPVVRERRGADVLPGDDVGQLHGPRRRGSGRGRLGLLPAGAAAAGAGWAAGFVAACWAAIGTSASSSG